MHNSIALSMYVSGGKWSLSGQFLLLFMTINRVKLLLETDPLHSIIKLRLIFRMTAGKKHVLRKCNEKALGLDFSVASVIRKKDLSRVPLRISAAVTSLPDVNMRLGAALGSSRWEDVNRGAAEASPNTLHVAPRRTAALPR